MRLGLCKETSAQPRTSPWGFLPCGSTREGSGSAGRADWGEMLPLQQLTNLNSPSPPALPLIPWLFPQEEAETVLFRWFSSLLGMFTARPRCCWLQFLLVGTESAAPECLV